MVKKLPTMKAHEHPVTIIVPVYGDWESLSSCVGSLKKYIDASRHTVMFVNDCGPEADAIEMKLKKAIKGAKNFHYFRNEQNLGFLKNCNNAVFHLDTTDNDILLLNSDTEVTEGFLEELLDVLYSSDNYAVASPRSNHATLVSIPIRVDGRYQYSPNYSRKVHTAVKDKLFRVGYPPVAHGFCILIKRPLIKKYGLYDEVYGMGYCEESDFCMRLAQDGYASVVANRAFVYHSRSKSFSEEGRLKLISQNEKILYRRYPYLPQMYKQYFTKYIDAVDWFCECFTDGPKKILLDISHLPQDDSPQATQALHFIHHVAARQKRSGYEFVIGVNRDVYEYHGLQDVPLRAVFFDATIEKFHLGVLFGGTIYPNNLAALNKHCARFIIVNLLDADAFIPVAERIERTLQHDTYRNTVRLAEKIVPVESDKQLTEELIAGADEKINVNKLRARWAEIVTYGEYESQLRGLAAVKNGRKKALLVKLAAIPKRFKRRLFAPLRR